jgi:hypothetical protein
VYEKFHGDERRPTVPRMDSAGIHPSAAITWLVSRRHSRSHVLGVAPPPWHARTSTRPIPSAVHLLRSRRDISPPPSNFHARHASGQARTNKVPVHGALTKPTDDPLAIRSVQIRHDRPLQAAAVPALAAELIGRGDATPGCTAGLSCR